MTAEDYDYLLIDISHSVATELASLTEERQTIFCDILQHMASQSGRSIESILAGQESSPEEYWEIKQIVQSKLKNYWKMIAQLMGGNEIRRAEDVYSRLRRGPPSDVTKP